MAPKLILNGPRKLRRPRSKAILNSIIPAARLNATCRAWRIQSRSDASASLVHISPCRMPHPSQVANTTTVWPGAPRRSNHGLSLAILLRCVEIPLHSLFLTLRRSLSTTLLARLRIYVRSGHDVGPRLLYNRLQLRDFKQSILSLRHNHCDK